MVSGEGSSSSEERGLFFSTFGREKRERKFVG